MKKFEEMIERVRQWQAAGIYHGETHVYETGHKDYPKIELDSGSGQRILCLKVIGEHGFTYEGVYIVHARRLDGLPLNSDVSDFLLAYLDSVIVEKPKVYLVIEEESCLYIQTVHPTECSESDKTMLYPPTRNIREYAKSVKNSLEVTGKIQVEIISW